MSDARIDIAQTVYEFAYGIDRRDWTAYRDTFVAPPATIEFDYTSYSGQPATTMDVDAWIGRITPLFNGLDATQHTMSNPVVERSADERSAHCRVYMQAAHFLDDAEFTIGGYYDDHLVLDVEDRWRIDAVRLTVWWRRGDDAIMRRARSVAKRPEDRSELT